MNFEKRTKINLSRFHWIFNNNKTSVSEIIKYFNNFKQQQLKNKINLIVYTFIKAKTLSSFSQFVLFIVGKNKKTTTTTSLNICIHFFKNFMNFSKTKNRKKFCRFSFEFFFVSVPSRDQQ